MRGWVLVVAVLAGCGPEHATLEAAATRLGVGTALATWPQPLEVEDVELLQVEGCRGVVMSWDDLNVNVLFYSPNLASCAGQNSARVRVTGCRR